MNIQENESLSSDQQQLLAAVTATENELGGDAGGAGPAGGPHVEQIDPVAENAALLQVLITMASPAMPFLPKIYTPEVVGQIAAAFTAVEQKYGWDVKSHLGPEVMLALVGIPPTITAVVVGRAYFAHKKAEADTERTVDEAQGVAANAGHE